MIPQMFGVLTNNYLHIGPVLDNRYGPVVLAGMVEAVGAYQHIVHII